MRFTWDEKKRRSNLKSHGIDFIDAPRVFEGPTFTFEDDRFDYGEARYVAIGVIGKRLHVVVFADRHGVTRIISLRKANKREQEIHAQKT